MSPSFFFFFFFNDTATTEIYPLSLHDALPISRSIPFCVPAVPKTVRPMARALCTAAGQMARAMGRSEEHTSELQSLAYLVCRLLLEKKKKTHQMTIVLLSGPSEISTT